VVFCGVNKDCVVKPDVLGEQEPEQEEPEALQEELEDEELDEDEEEAATVGAASC